MSNWWESMPVVEPPAQQQSGNWWDEFPVAEPPQQRPYRKLDSEVGQARSVLKQGIDPVSSALLGPVGSYAASKLGLGDDITSSMTQGGASLLGVAARGILPGQMKRMRPVGEFLGMDVPTDEQIDALSENLADDLNRTGKAFEMAAAEGDKPGLTGMVQKGARNLGSTLPASFVAAQVGGPYAAIAPGILTTGSQAMTEGKDADLKGDALNRYVRTSMATEGLISAFFQRIGLGGVEGQLAKQTASGGLRKALLDQIKTQGGEFLEENSISFMQALNDAAMKVDPSAMTPEALVENFLQTTVTSFMGGAVAGAPQIATGAMRDAQAANLKQSRPGVQADRTTRQTAARADFFSPPGLDAAKAWLNTQGTLDATAAKDSISRDEWERLGLPRDAGRSASDRKAFLDTLKAPPAPLDPDATLEDIPRPAEPTPETEGRLDPGTRINELLAQGPVSISDGKWTYQVIGLLDDKVRTKGGKLLPLAKVASGEYSVTPLAPAPTGPAKPATPVPMDPTVTDTSIAPPEAPMPEVLAPETVPVETPVPLTYEQFEQQYKDAFAQANKYGPNAVGGTEATQRMAELADQYPEFAERVEQQEAANAQPSPVPQNPPAVAPEAAPEQAAPVGEVAGVEAIPPQDVGRGQQGVGAAGEAGDAVVTLSKSPADMTEAEVRDELKIVQSTLSFITRVMPVGQVTPTDPQWNSLHDRQRELFKRLRDFTAAADAKKAAQEEARRKAFNEKEDARKAALPTKQTRNGWELATDGTRWYLRDPNTKEIVYDGKLKRVREVADESPPDVPLPAPTTQERRGPTTMESRGPAPSNLHVPVYHDAGQGRPISEHDIIATLAKDFDVPIRKGHMAKPKQVAGIYKVLPEVIRTRGKFAGDLAVVSHEVGHHIDKGQGNVSRVLGSLDPAMKSELQLLDYDKTKKRDFEGFAEYIRLLWTTDDAAQAAPRFHEWFGKYLDARPDLKAKFDRAKELMTRWRKQGASSRFRAQRQQRGWRPRAIGQTVWEQIKDGAASFRKRLVYELADRFNVIREIDKEVLGAGFDTKGDATAGQLAAAYNMATAAHAERAIMGGVHTVSKNHRVLGAGLKDAFTPLKAGEYEDWADYHLARHVVDVNNKTRENILADSPYNPGMRYDDAGYLVDQVRADPDRYARFEQVSQALTQINNDRIEMLVDAGVLSSEDAAKMLDKWGQTYTSLRRVKPSDLVSRLASSVLEIKQPVRSRSKEGSALPVMDPVEATILNIMEAYDSALKQQVMVKLAEETVPQFGGIEGMGEFVELLPADRKATSGTVEEILKSLEQAGFDPDLIKEIAIVAKLRRGEGVSKPSLEWIASRYGVDPTTEFAIDDILDKTDAVPDAETAIALWRPDYSPNKHERIVRLVYRGQPRMLQLSPELYDALQGMNPIQIHPMLRVLQGMTRLTKLGATSLNVGFAGANVFADYPAFIAQTKHTSGFDSFYLPLAAGLWNARAEIPQIAGEAVGVVSPQFGDKVKRGIDYALEAVAGKPNPVVELWNEFGGKIATRLGADKTTLRNVRGDITGQHGVSLLERGGRAVDALRDTIGLFEAGPRIAEFMGYLKEQGYSLKNGKLVDASGNAARPSRGQLIGATLAARDVTTDFTKAGRAGRFADQFLAFFNAAVQSNIKFAKTLKEIGTGQKNWKQRAIALSAMASGALIYALMRGDDDDYREQPEWLKRRYWTFGQDGQTWYRVRKPHDWAIVSNAIEQMVAMWRKTDPQSLAQFVAEELHARNPVDPTSVSGMPFVEAGSNYSFFRRGPIENERMQDVSPEHRAYPWNSPAAKFIGYYTGKSMGWGPAKIDYVLNETSGGLWGRTVGAENMEAAAQKWSGGSAFMLNKDYPEAVEEFYDTLGKATQKAASAKFLGKDDPAATAEAARLNRYAELMKAIRQPVNQETDRQKRFEHEKYIVGLARKILGREELDAYPNPLSRTDLPPAVQSAVDEHLGGLLMSAAEGPYQRQKGQSAEVFAEKQAERDAQVAAATDAIKESEIDDGRVRTLIIAAGKRRGYGSEAIGERLARIRGRL